MTGWRRNGRTGRRGQVLRSAGAPRGNSFSMVKGGDNGDVVLGADTYIVVGAAEHEIAMIDAGITFLS